MPPKVKFQKEEIAEAALQVARRSGIDAVTAREVAAELKVSPRPIFTWFASMEELRHEVYELARQRYLAQIRLGLEEPIPFLGMCRQYLLFAREEPMLYRLLFLTPPGQISGGAMEVLRYSQELARPSLMRIYHMDADTADKYFRDLWLVAFSFATLIVTDDCPYSEEKMLAIGTEFSIAVCKAYKEIPGLAEGDYERDAIFRALVGRQEAQA